MKPGPIPKRSEELIRRNIPEVPVTKVEAEGKVRPPRLNIPDADPMVVEFYDSLKKSAQVKYFEPSDWQLARFACRVMDKCLKAQHINGAVLATLNSMFQGLLVTEDSRRRLKIEVDRVGPSQDTTMVDLANAFEKQAKSGGRGS